ncbi:MAG TPA: 4'-phosphopantetheinyl transferase superfamily protein [Vicinamibacteria bacterium]|nr:4'-phosphopantetheinyl transferase superfamily protein [Vicinamibacteria bacterium]
MPQPFAPSREAPLGLFWLSQGMTDVPADDGWLSAREAAWIARLRFAKRRSEFRLGRWTAKNALARYLRLPMETADLRAIEIDRADDGAPAPLLGGRPADAYLTMTDRADQAVCVVGPPGARLGVDLELVEQRSDAFIADYLTAGEQRLVAAARDLDERSLLANLIWCGKESALKVLRTGLRRDTRSVLVWFPSQPPAEGWAAMSVQAVEGTVFPGWWRRYGEFVLTLAATERFPPPQPLVDPPGLATAVPAHSWLPEGSSPARG